MQSQAAPTVCHAPAHGATEHSRRQPESTLLYKTLQAHWRGFLTEIETEGGELPAFVCDEFEAYFRCGILAHGFLRVRCKDCGHSRVRDKVVPSSAEVEYRHGTAPAETREVDPRGVPRLNRLPWAVLLKRVFLADFLECPKCKGRMKILAAVTEPTSVRRVLHSLGLASEAPRLRSARPPPQADFGDERAQSDDFYADPPILDE